VPEYLRPRELELRVLDQHRGMPVVLSESGRGLRSAASRVNRLP
jgi:hypothetical protein